MEEDNQRLKEADEIKFYQFSEESYKQAKDQVEEWFDDELLMYEDSEKIDKFLNKALRYFGFWGDYVDLCDDEFFGYDREYARSVALFQAAYPNEKMKKEELSIYAAILRCLGAITGISYNSIEMTRKILGIDKEDLECEELACYKPDDILVGERKRVEKSNAHIINLFRY